MSQTQPDEFWHDWLQDAKKEIELYIERLENAFARGQPDLMLLATSAMLTGWQEDATDPSSPTSPAEITRVPFFTDGTRRTVSSLDQRFRTDLANARDSNDWLRAIALFSGKPTQ